MTIERKRTLEPLEGGIIAGILTGALESRWIDTSDVSMLNICYTLTDADSSVTLLKFEVDDNPGGAAAANTAFERMGMDVTNGATEMEADLKPAVYHRVPAGTESKSFLIPVSTPRTKIRIPIATGAGAADKITCFITKIMGV
jgi:hypothetical protein